MLYRLLQFRLFPLAPQSPYFHFTATASTSCTVIDSLSDQPFAVNEYPDYKIRLVDPGGLVNSRLADEVQLHL